MQHTDQQTHEPTYEMYCTTCRQIQSSSAKDLFTGKATSGAVVCPLPPDNEGGWRLHSTAATGAGNGAIQYVLYTWVKLVPGSQYQAYRQRLDKNAV